MVKLVSGSVIENYELRISNLENDNRELRKRLKESEIMKKEFEILKNVLKKSNMDKELNYEKNKEDLMIRIDRLRKKISLMDNKSANEKNKDRLNRFKIKSQLVEDLLNTKDIVEREKCLKKLT